MKKIKLYGIRFTYKDGSKDPKLYGKFLTKEEAIKFEEHERMALRWGSDLKTTIAYKSYTLKEFLGKDDFKIVSKFLTY